MSLSAPEVSVWQTTIFNDTLQPQLEDTWAPSQSGPKYMDISSVLGWVWV